MPLHPQGPRVPHLLPHPSDSFLALPPLHASLHGQLILIILPYIPDTQQDLSLLEGRFHTIEEGESQLAVLGEGITKCP